MAQNIQDWLAGFAAEIGTVPPTRGELDMLLELTAGKRLAAGSEANGS